MSFVATTRPQAVSWTSEKACALQDASGTSIGVRWTQDVSIVEHLRRFVNDALASDEVSDQNSLKISIYTRRSEDETQRRLS